MTLEPPQNGEYLAAAYIVAVLIVVGYFLALLRRARNLRSRSPAAGEKSV